MITIKFLGGAKKSFSTDSMDVDRDDISVQDLLEYLAQKKPENTLELDTDNILVAINGADSSVMGGMSARIRSGDTVTIIPVIHGGARLQFRIGSSAIEMFSIAKDKNIDETYLDNLRESFPGIVIQGISKKYLLGKSHAQKILSVSLYAKKRGILLSQKLETDILMRFAGTTQISKAISRIGISKKDGFVIIAIGAKTRLDKMHLKLKPGFDLQFFAKNNEKFLAGEFNITKKHIQAIDSKTPLEDLLAEQAAVLF